MAALHRQFRSMTLDDRVEGLLNLISRHPLWTPDIQRALQSGDSVYVLVRYMSSFYVVSDFSRFRPLFGPIVAC